MPEKTYFLFLVFMLAVLNYQTFSQEREDPRERNGPNKLYPILFNYARNLYQEYDHIPQERKYILKEIANYLIGSVQFEGKAELLLIGSNNATRSIMAEAWANAASHYYGTKRVNIYSGGLKNDTISKFGIMALEKAGFIAYKTSDSPDATYELKYTFNEDPLILNSKKISNKEIPDFKFGAVVICANADINLPVVKGNNFRTSLYYFDPAAYEESPDVLDVYLERSREIAVEMFYLFYLIKNAKQR